MSELLTEIKKAYIHLIRLPLYWLLPILLLVGIAINGICELLGADYSNNIYNTSRTTNEIFAVLILAPIIESLIFQQIPIEVTQVITKKIFNKRYPIISSLISSILFAVDHSYSVGYFIMTFFLGLILSVLYLTLRYRMPVFFAYLTLVLFHSVYNLSIITINRILI